MNIPDTDPVVAVTATSVLAVSAGAFNKPFVLIVAPTADQATVWLALDGVTAAVH